MGTIRALCNPGKVSTKTILFTEYAGFINYLCRIKRKKYTQPIPRFYVRWVDYNIRVRKIKHVFQNNFVIIIVVFTE